MGLKILAPLAGWCAPLSEVPDAAFAQGMLGEGVAIDPTGNELRAPCDGEVISIAAARHAVALRTPGGAEILIHVGIDTVALGGTGFAVSVRKGDRVHAGDPLMSFDLALLSRQAPSLMTPIIITNGERFRISRGDTGRIVMSGDVLFELEEIGASLAASGISVPGAVPVVSEAVVVTHAHGIHARPAAMIARLAKTLPYELELRARGRAANARSAVALMSLGVRGGDELVISGFDPAASAGISQITKLIRNLAHEAPHAHGATVTATTMPPAEPGVLRAVVASQGLALGPAFYLDAGEIPVVEAGTGVTQEGAAFDHARAAVRTRLTRLGASAAPTVRDIMTAHLELLDDPQLIESARAAMSTGKSAGFAWRAALRASAAALRATGDARLAERVDDLRDLERQVLSQIAGVAVEAAPIPPGAILLARDLTPSQLIDLDTGRLGGIALAGGGPTSHVAILAGTLGVPMLVAAGLALLDAVAGAEVILDAEAGTLRIAPTKDELDSTRRSLAQREARRGQEQAAAQSDCRLASGERIEVFANLAGSVADAALAVAHGAEGCGLLRTEFLFLERETAPDEREQRTSYQQVAGALSGRPLIIRTLDIGGDKPIPYLPLPPEENPALGLRGIRTSLWRPDLLEVQLRALLGVEPASQLRILLPMITDIAEIRSVRATLDVLCAELDRERPPLGAMIETPAAAMLADAISAEVDFLSIGTNDLAQYTLAMDRGHAELAARIDGLHPAVLRLIAATTSGAARHGRPVAVCGGLASDVQAVPVLIGLGVTELSVVPKLIPRSKVLIHGLTLERCRELAAQALALTSAAEVRALISAGATP
ncbi:MAG: phosphoenolpyruvate--protein phosphotransferase [Pseudomonadota bacterium]